jgi:hypothetical protein
MKTGPSCHIGTTVTSSQHALRTHIVVSPRIRFLIAQNRILYQLRGIGWLESSGSSIDRPVMLDDATG